MQNKKWKKFEKLTDKCFLNLAGLGKDGKCWVQTFELLKEIVLEERKNNPAFAPELELLDDATDYEYDIQGWVEDCLDEIDMRGESETLLNMCNDLLNLFSWPEYTGSDIKFRKMSALSQLGKYKEAARYCKEWVQKEPENIIAAAAGVYAYMGTEEYGEAEKLVDQFIIDKTECSEENDIMFTAASKLYGAMGKRKEKKQIDKAMKEYEEYLEKYMMDMDFGDDELDEMFDEFPFF